jgi:hypothetical protein
VLPKRRLACHRDIRLQSGKSITCLTEQQPHVCFLIITYPHQFTPECHKICVGDVQADSDAAFVLKLVAWSFIGGAAVKYGSLLSPVAFTADPALAAVLVASPPLMYAIVTLVSQSKSGSSSSSN